MAINVFNGSPSFKPTIATDCDNPEPPTVLPPDFCAYSEPVNTLPLLSITKGVNEILPDTVSNLRGEAKSIDAEVTVVPSLSFKCLNSASLPDTITFFHSAILF